MRSPMKVTVSPVAVGGARSPWLPLDYLQRQFNAGLFVSLSADATGITYSVEYTPDNPNNIKGNSFVSLTRVTTVATLTMALPHGLVVGDAVKIYNSGDANFDGDQTVATVPSPTSLTYAVANVSVTVGGAYTQAIFMRVFPLAAALTAATTKQSAMLGTPAWAVRLNVTAWTTGSATLEVVQGLGCG